MGTERNTQRAYLDSLNKKLVIVGKLNQDGSKDKSAESDYIDFSQKDNVIMALSRAQTKSLIASSAQRYSLQ
jgi:hypothetical protein